MMPTEKWQTILCGNCGNYRNFLLDETMMMKIVSGNAKGWRKLDG